MPRNLLVITYEFPPSGGGGVQRVAKLCRFLPTHAWVPHVVTAEPVPGRSLDTSLLGDVEGVDILRTPARHVATAISSVLIPFKRVALWVRRMIRGRGAVPSGASAGVAAESGASTIRNASASSRIARWVAVPDDAVWWKRPAVKAAIELGRASGVEAVFASGPPFSALVVGARVARTLGVPFVADMRDGWETNPVVVLPTKLHYRYSARLERRTVPQAAIVTCTTPAIAAEATRFGAKATSVIPNGFDADDLPSHAPDLRGPLKIVYMGKVYFGHSDPTPFLESLARLSSADGPASRVEFDLVGTWPKTIEDTVARLGLAERVRLHEYLPHREALGLVAQADLGLVLIADRPGAAGSAPAKLYEYLGMGLPTLLVGPRGGYPAQVLDETRAGVRVDPGDPRALDAVLTRLAVAKAAGTALATPDADAVARFDRRKQAAEFARKLEMVTAR
jgi:glycosyltransferase involved in cell wall biosynthesis